MDWECVKSFFDGTGYTVAISGHVMDETLTECVDCDWKYECVCPTEKQ